MNIYLDYNATTPVESSVVDDIVTALNDQWGNPSSGHRYGRAAKSSVDKARKNMAKMINGTVEDIVFTSGGTEANNMVIYSALETYRNWIRDEKTEIPTSKPHFISSNVEHDATTLPLKYLENKGDIDVSFVPVGPNGRILVDDIISAIKPNTCLITIIFANNETGVIMPIADIGRSICKINQERKKRKLFRILYHTDAAQAIGKIPVNVEEAMIDYLTVVGHKFYGPRIGCLYVRSPGLKTPLYPILFGGGQERGYRPGTENTPMICGLGKAAELVIFNLESYMEHFARVKQHLEKRLKEVFGDKVVFNCKNKGVDILPNTCSIAFIGEGLSGRLVLDHCQKVIASVGAACHSENKCSAILLASGVPKEHAENAIRLSVGRETTCEQIDLAVDDLKMAVDSVKIKFNV